MRIVLILDIDQLDLFFPQVFFQMEKEIFFKGRINVNPQLILLKLFFPIQINFRFVYECIGD